MIHHWWALLDAALTIWLFYPSTHAADAPTPCLWPITVSFHCPYHHPDVLQPQEIVSLLRQLWSSPTVSLPTLQPWLWLLLCCSHSTLQHKPRWVQSIDEWILLGCHEGTTGPLQSVIHSMNWQNCTEGKFAFVFHETVAEHWERMKSAHSILRLWML